ENGRNRPKDSPFYNDAGKLVIVRVTGKTLSRVGEAPIGRWSQGAVFSPDGKRILVGNMVEKDYWVFQWSGGLLKDTGQRVKVNGGPAAVRAAEKEPGHPRGRVWAKNLSATATCMAMPLASADSFTSMRGEWFGNAAPLAGRVLRFTMAPGIRCSTYEKSSLAIVG